ncbi:LamG-like jellyroll fold domain-containing protein [Christiangramia sediminicola]|uniref:LamG-like jellyroll fold domain-containing protein n=1 Tax=Christiangramia sediminicola TaxID=3073267 RepID=A0ABU1EMF7_9FLAO|nr:LamG-like jellyroll fold domain-containing protein [Christiangramia sp. SM2212]MDR5589564.1 LamG-like jellyroll fold domain-containing protein [Christiangramia sp. SM2212]
MYKTTCGPQFHSFKAFYIILFTLLSWSGASLNAQNLSISLDSKTNATCPNTSDGAISISVTGGNSPYSYSWTGPNYSKNEANNISGLAGGTYTVTVTDSSDPQLSESKNFTIDDTDSINPDITAPNDITFNSDSVSCFKSNYNLGTESTSDNCGVASVTNDAPSEFKLGDTTVTWTVTDNSGNTSQDTQKVTVLDETDPIINAPADVTFNTDSDSCFKTNYNLGSESTSDNCGVASITNDAPTKFGLGETIVTWTVTDNSGNTAQDIQKVTVIDKTDPFITAPSDVQANTDSNDCNASNVNLGTPNTNDNCGVASVENDAPAEFPLGETTVTWIVKDDAGNTASATQKVVISDKTNPTITAPADLSFFTDSNSCFKSNYDLGSESTSDNCGVASIINDAPAEFPLGETTVTWTVTDDSGNTSQDTQKITVEDNVKPVITAGNTVEATNDTGLCQAGLGIAPATASDNCSVGNPVGTRSDGLGLDEPYPVGTTTISWNVKDAQGNAAETVIQEVIVADNQAPEIPTIEDITWGCEYTVDAPVTSDNCSGEITGTTTDPITYSNAGTYTITWNFTDENGNTAQATQKITIQPIEAEATKVDVLCNGLATGEVEAIATGGVAPLRYDWGSLGTGAKKTDLPAGSYTVTVSDANGCEAEPITVIVEEPDTFVEITGVQTTTGCFEENNGTATVTVQGGVGSYTYLWDNGQTDETATGLSPGEHTVTVTDANGCSKERTFTVSEPAELLVTGFLTTETTSFGSNTGSATAQVTGGTPNYTFEWIGGPTGKKYTGQTARDLAAGIYTVTVTDANGCTATGEVEVVDSLSANIVPISLCEGEDVIRTSTFSVDGGSAIGGTAPYTYEWNFGESASPATGTGAGPIDVKYGQIGDKLITLTVTDAKGREFTQQVIQFVGGCFADDCGSNDLGLDYYFIGDANQNPISSNDQCEQVDQKFIYINFPTQATRYSLQIELIYSIENLETGTINNYKVKDCFYEYEAIPKTAKTFPIEYNCGDEVKVEGVYLTFQNNVNRACGTTATNGNGNGNGNGGDGGNNPKCFSTNNESTVRSPLFAIAFANELLCNGAMNGTVTSRASGGSGNYSFELLDENGNLVEGPQSDGTFEEQYGGDYFVRVTDTDSNETFTSKKVTIEEPSNPLTLEISSQTNVSCFGGTDGQATLVASGGTPDYIYVWPDGQTTANATNLTAGEYDVRVVDANGCEVITTVVIEQPVEITPNAGPDQVLGCGFSSTQLKAEENLDENGEPVTGNWTIVNGPAGGSFADGTDRNTIFTGAQGTYTLRWSVSCGKSDDVKISFTSCSTLDFDGLDDHVNFGDNYGFTNGVFTVEAWIKPKSNDGTRTIMSKKDIADPASGFELVMENGVPNFKTSGSSSFTSDKIGTDRWYHVAISFNGSAYSLYVDGLLLGTNSGSGPYANSAPFLLGAIYDSAEPNLPKNPFHGWMEEVRLWSKALSADQIQLMMNQHISENNSSVKGEVLPIVTPNLTWSDLQGYYRLQPSEITGGFTDDRATNKVKGRLVNITTTQETTAPLPYYSVKNGNWWDSNNWEEPAVWDVPNSTGINGEKIDWNIAVTSHTLTSNYKDIVLLGLISKSGTTSRLDMQGSVNDQTGNELYVSHYLQLNGVIDLNGESQLVQPEGSILENSSSGYLDRDQQGTANSFNYNYWTPPVSLIGQPNNSGFSIQEVLKDGSNPTDTKSINFNYQYHWADGKYSGNKRISTYWLHTFKGNDNDYSEWHQFGPEEQLQSAIGYSMKGTTGYVPVRKQQNYTFRGKPNNGDITVSIGAGQNLLTGNPYPSAIDSKLFIEENLGSFNGSLYYWDHFGAINTHILEEYVGGYAVYNLSGGVASASSVDSRINPNGDRSSNDPPGKYIPVGQGFFVSSVGVSSPSTITFKNKYRAFTPETSSESLFHSQEPTNTKAQEPRQKYTADSRYKIRLKFESPKGYHRQILVTADANSTSDFDFGYDAPLIDNNVEDMYWMINENEFVIQAVPNFNLDQVLPIGFKIAEPGEYAIKIDELENIKMEFNIYLKDKLNNTYHNLKEDFVATADETGTFHDRYEIVFRKPVAEKPEEELPSELIDEPILDLSYFRDTDEIAVLNPDLLKVDHVELYSISGQLIKTFDEVPTERSILLSINQKLSSAVYIVKMYSGEKTYSRKVIITK